jgi:hypothetical protein
MKKKDLLCLILAAACLGVWICYQTLNDLRTDNTPPEIVVEDRVPELSVRDSAETLLQGVTARDAVDGDVTDSLVVESIRLLRQDGTVTVTYAAFDGSGNVSKKTREALYTDYESPRFSLNRALLFGQKSYDLLSVITASDMLDGDITGRIRATALDEVVTDYNGTYRVRFQVTNTLGDTVDLVLPVEVYTPGNMEANMTLTEYLVYLTDGDSFNARDYLGELTVGRETVTLGRNLPDTMKLTVSGKVDTGVPGVYVVDYQLVYSPDLRWSDHAYTAYSKLIVVVEG